MKPWPSRLLTFALWVVPAFCWAVDQAPAPWHALSTEFARKALRTAGSRNAPNFAQKALMFLVERAQRGGGDMSLVVSRITGGVRPRRTPLFEHQPDCKRNPASLSKLATAIFAAHVLGSDYRFPTIVSRWGKNLGVRGGFDPSLTRSSIESMARDLKEAGVLHIAGDILVDQGPLVGNGTPAGYESHGASEHWPFLAPVSNPCVNGNVIAITVSPAAGRDRRKVAVLADQDAFEVHSTVELVQNGASTRLGCGLIDNNTVVPIIHVWGRLAAADESVVLRMKSPNPTHSFATIMKSALAEAHIHHAGRIGKGDVSVEAKTVCMHESEPLRVLLANSISQSIALDHELYLLAAAAKGRETISPQVASKLLIDFLHNDMGLRDVFMANGSGIGESNRLSARDIQHLLERATTVARYDAVADGLARPGQPGMLQRRMLGTEAVNRLRAKTGTGSHTVALAGTVGDEPATLVFAGLIDSSKPSLQVRDNMRAVLDALGIVLSEISKGDDG